MNHPSTIDKYQIIAHLGCGSFGQVYRVFDRALQAEKALKVLGVTDPSQFISSLEEAQILNKCSHKHIVSINEANVFRVSGDLRVVLDLEYIAEGSMEGALKYRWISIRDATTFLRGALLGLEHAHSQGFLHRDIKPGNILLDSAGAKLSDFGLATHCRSDLTGSAKGYTTHLPPEYWVSKETSAKSDIFAAGVTLYRAVSNISDWKAVVRAIPSARAKVESGKLIETIGFEEFIPKAIRRIIKKACHPESSKRYESAQELRQQLDRLRYSLDWICIDDLTWEGRLGSNVHAITIDRSKNCMIYRKNGRRQTNKCATYHSLSEAVSAMHTEVANSTLQ